MNRPLALAACGTLLALSAGPAVAQQQLEIRLGDGAAAPVSGRLLVFAQPWSAYQAGTPVAQAMGPRPSATSPQSIYVASHPVEQLNPGQSLQVKVDAAYPAAFSTLPRGEYAVRAVLDVDANFPYRTMPSAGDWLSPVARVDLGTARTVLVLNQVAGPQLPEQPAGIGSEWLDFQSPSLTAFHGRPTFIRGVVVKPPGYGAGNQRYPVVYRTDGFGSTLQSLAIEGGAADRVYKMMSDGVTPPMIWVLLDHAGDTGTHEFADSANNGPWGQALTEELIPWLEQRYRMDGRPSGRFLTGHSSGGWFAIWNQVRYPKVFGGAWPTAPDPVDFREFTSIDIYAPGANAYVRPDGQATALVRRGTQVAATFRDYTQVEDAMGGRGGQIASFEWVFSPRGSNGQPKPLFDRKTGAIDPEVAAHWRNYDIAHIVRSRWPELRPDLDGKIHLIVGTEDTFYLEKAAYRLKAVLDELGAKPDFRFVEGRNHSNLDLPGGLARTIAWEMYAVARPGSFPPPNAAAPAR